jgi:hypothetical protein
MATAKQTMNTFNDNAEQEQMSRKKRRLAVLKQKRHRTSREVGSSPGV